MSRNRATVRPNVTARSTSNSRAASEPSVAARYTAEIVGRAPRATLAKILRSIAAVTIARSLTAASRQPRLPQLHSTDEPVGR